MSPPAFDFRYGEMPKSHNFGTKCRLAPVSFSHAHLADVPPVKAQYFYASPIPIDDPLSASTIAATTDPKSARNRLQPFSPADNNALENAWLGLASDEYQRNHRYAQRDRSPSPSLARANSDRLATIIRSLAVKHVEKHAREGPGRELTGLTTNDSFSAPDIDIPLCCSELLVDVGLALRSSFCAVARRRQQTLDRERVAQAVMLESRNLQTDWTASVVGERVSSTSLSSDSLEAETVLRSRQLEKHTSSHHVSDSRDSNYSGSGVRAQTQTTAQTSIANDVNGVPLPAKASFVDDGISGKPFVRVGTPETTTFSPPSSLPRPATLSPRMSRPNEERKGDRAATIPSSRGGVYPSEPEWGKNLSRATAVDVPVGVSRLHEVTLPALQMKPIYWSPVNDLAIVLRATWFYRDDMRPVDPAVANQLESGYRELRPHSETWQDELKCAVDVGPLGEEKVSHPLWPAPPKSNSKYHAQDLEPPIPSNPFCAARCFHGEAATEGTLDPGAHEDTPTHQGHKKFEQYHVIYKDETTAFLLKPSLRPSAYYGRRPVAKIVRGLTIGIPVVRGFDYETWMKKHHRGKTRQQSGQQPRSSATFGRATNDEVCPACKAEKDRSQITDLVLVAHGIGQKLAERVENYHFTHAINAFRRSINIELGSPEVKGVLREGQNGIMVLPVNWRQNLSFEDGGPMKEEDKADYTPGLFSLDDIEPKTIPAVRSMISDVMFDIPFYMSHHKPRMVAAMVAEANRVYRLWCQNNPGFSENGRVHLIGHSLGSVMAVEILSKQPTNVPKLRLEVAPEINHFEFDTKNLFLIGSPAAFFLLLEKGALLPRRGRRKPGAEPADTVSQDVTGGAGLFGCLSVDNIYNILAREDPVAYLLNGTVDPVYAASLKTAYVPSATTSILQSMGNAVMSMVPGVSTTSAGNPALGRPPTLRLPSQLELEVHDFTREETAERKAFLLNDNGQIDYFLRSGGGPLELQYLNMLSAHTSYWTNLDLVRLLCMEIGRKPGKKHTLPAMRAVKSAKRLIPSRTPS
ncbi:DDHD domain-containing protein [Xylariomycetidae sp. FL2044]|nr:DDHD domain-containing protein [Xylariomycetidae sp. FL2044]